MMRHHDGHGMPESPHMIELMQMTQFMCNDVHSQSFGKRRNPIIERTRSGEQCAPTARSLRTNAKARQTRKASIKSRYIKLAHTQFSVRNTPVPTAENELESKTSDTISESNSQDRRHIDLRCTRGQPSREKVRKYIPRAHEKENRHEEGRHTNPSLLVSSLIPHIVHTRQNDIRSDL